MFKVKLFAILVLAIMVIALVAQNTQEVETRLLFVTITMPRAVLLMITTLIGFCLGLLTAFFAVKRQARKK